MSMSESCADENISNSGETTASNDMTPEAYGRPHRYRQSRRAVPTPLEITEIGGFCEEGRNERKFPARSARSDSAAPAVPAKTSTRAARPPGGAFGVW